MPPNFFQTMMGKRFFESTAPSILEQIKKLNENLERINTLLEESLEKSKGDNNE